MATHSSVLSWRIPWMEGPGGLQSMGLERVKHDKQLTHTHTHTHTPTEDIAAYWFPSNEEYSFKLRREKSLGIWELSFV